MRILVLGASGMLGNAVLKVCSEKAEHQAFGTVRAASSRRFFEPGIADKLITGIDVLDQDSLTNAFIQARPDVVINCVGLVKQLEAADDPLQAVPINTLLPHRLAKLCEVADARLVHISTDCVFSGEKGGYLESDPSDAEDLYGKTKFLGEVAYPNSITLRTSIIGHELQNAHSLIDWFLAQNGACRGYTNAIFSGVPTVVLAHIIRDVVLPRPELSGLYHVAAQPINKYDLLKLVAKVYGKEIEITPDDKLRIDRSLNGARFSEAFGYSTPEWEEMIKLMFTYK